MGARKYKVGDTFISASNWCLESKPLVPMLLQAEPYPYHREGHKGYFVKGNRKYFCEVIAIIEMSTKWVYSYWPNVHNVALGYADLGVKQYRFTYLVKILEV